MRCDNCKFEYCVSNEPYTEYYCELFDEDVPEEFATEEGCNLMFNEAKKLSELSHDIVEKSCDIINMYYIYYGIEEGPTKEQQAEIYRKEKEHDLAEKKLKDYKDILLNRRKKK
jgi:hypothetical protein